MILDKTHEFSNAQAITSAAGSTNTLDLGPGARRDIGVGEDIYVVVVVTVAFTDASSNSTLTVALEGDSTTTFTPDGTENILLIPALAAVGDVFVAKLGNYSLPLQYQYVRLLYTPNNGDLSTGSVSAYLTSSAHAWRAFPKNYTIS